MTAAAAAKGRRRRGGNSEKTHSISVKISRPGRRRYGVRLYKVLCVVLCDVVRNYKKAWTFTSIYLVLELQN